MSCACTALEMSSHHSGCSRRGRAICRSQSQPCQLLLPVLLRRNARRRSHFKGCHGHQGVIPKSKQICTFQKPRPLVHTNISQNGGADISLVHIRMSLKPILKLAQFWLILSPFPIEKVCFLQNGGKVRNVAENIKKEQRYENFLKFRYTLMVTPQRFNPMLVLTC